MGRSSVAALAIALLAAAGVTFVVRAAPPQSVAHTPAQADIATEAEARALCSVCHLFPPPEILPKSAWRDEIARMHLIRSNQPQPAGPAGTTGRMVVLPPDLERALRYYEHTAPERLPPPAPWPKADTGTFVKRAT